MKDRLSNNHLHSSYTLALYICYTQVYAKIVVLRYPKSVTTTQLLAKLNPFQFI